MPRTKTARPSPLDEAIRRGDLALIRPTTSPRGHILSRREHRLARNRIRPQETLCGKRFRRAVEISRAEFNDSACGRCSRRFTTLVEVIP